MLTSKNAGQRTRSGLHTGRTCTSAYGSAYAHSHAWCDAVLSVRVPSTASQSCSDAQSDASRPVISAVLDSNCGALAFVSGIMLDQIDDELQRREQREETSVDHWSTSREKPDAVGRSVPKARAGRPGILRGGTHSESRACCRVQPGLLQN